MKFLSYAMREKGNAGVIFLYNVNQLYSQNAQSEIFPHSPFREKNRLPGVKGKKKLNSLSNLSRSQHSLDVFYFWNNILNESKKIKLEVFFKQTVPKTKYSNKNIFMKKKYIYLLKSILYRFDDFTV